ncbi:MAG TPA: DUF3570 domain-containing protein, partial [Telluria sp.]|nr:DUF3570 domain-containing protein [Telluria sp.]
YRYYRDTFGIRAHTLSEEYVQPLGGGWTLTPSARLYSQSAASFYFDAVYDPVFGPPSPPNFQFTPGLLITQDQRMAAFGALTLGLKAEKKLGADWVVDVKFEDYQQRAALHLGGTGSPGLAPFYARTWQLSLTRLW